MNGDESRDSGCIVPKQISLPYVERVSQPDWTLFKPALYQPPTSNDP